MNMSYCMFENTYNDLVDIWDELEENNFDIEEVKKSRSSEYEKRNVKKLMDLCIDISEAVYLDE